ncbi:hypothetical protein FRB95_002859 [Tulasnella sp. JGI-2019a]|nr:hypothetical protein FRB95_002859 [Tulasnella sp. JGI-2019a]
MSKYLPPSNIKLGLRQEKIRNSHVVRSDKTSFEVVKGSGEESPIIMVRLQLCFGPQPIEMLETVRSRANDNAWMCKLFIGVEGRKNGRFDRAVCRHVVYVAGD